MKEFEGTKGKWFVKGEKYFSIESKIENNREVCIQPLIATINNTFVSVEEAQTNAQLIAAAPEMLDFLNEFIELGNDYDWRPEDELNELYVIAMELKNKALGKEESNE